MARFVGQVCLVTGGAQGIGLGVAKRLASEGASTIILFDLGDCSEAVSSLEKLCPHVLGVNVDVTKEEDVNCAVQNAIAECGKVSVVVQAAGVTGRTGIKSHEVEFADFKRVFEVNVNGTFLVAKAVLPSMLKEGYGRIVNIASISGKDGNAGMLAYSASKAAVINLTKVLGKDYANLGKDITINCVAPAVVRTAILDGMPPEQVKYMTDKIPMCRCGEIPEVASTICFAASSECSFTTGFCFDVTGGRAVY